MVVVVVMVRRHAVMGALLLQMAVVMVVVVMSRIPLQGVQRCRYSRTGSVHHFVRRRGCTFRTTEAINPLMPTQRSDSEWQGENCVGAVFVSCS
jgi:hypothetical protein